MRQVASQEQVATLRAQLAQPATPPVQDLDSVRADVLSRVDGPIKALWPSASAELAGYEFGFKPDGSLLRIKYKAEDSLAPPFEEVLARALAGNLGIANLQVVLEDVSRPPLLQSKANRRAPPRRR